MERSTPISDRSISMSATTSTSLAAWSTGSKHSATPSNSNVPPPDGGDGYFTAISRCSRQTTPSSDLWAAVPLRHRARPSATLTVDRSGVISCRNSHRTHPPHTHGPYTVRLAPQLFVQGASVGVTLAAEARAHLLPCLLELDNVARPGRRDQ